MNRSLIVAATLAVACTGSQQQKRSPAADPGQGNVEAKSPTMTVSAPSATAVGERPRYDQTGTRLVHVVGEPGERDIAVTTLGGDGALLKSLTERYSRPGDDIDPTWTPDGRIVFASKTDGDFDLWVLDPDNDRVEQVTNRDGDEIEPTVSPIPFGFFAVHNGVCGSKAGGRALDAYYKVLFTHRTPKSEQVRFTSLKPSELPASLERRAERDPIDLSAHDAHAGPISPPGKSCHDPSFAGDALSAVYVCDEAIHDAPARFEQSFQAALDALQKPDRAEAPNACRGWSVDFDKCLPALARRYTEYTGDPISTADDRLHNPSLSANQTVVLADRDGELFRRARFGDEAKWTPLDVGTDDASDVVWSPTGEKIAFTSGDKVQQAATDFYLQSVRNLHQFTELFGAGESQLLQQNRFVVRPGEHKEFYVLHDKLRYAERPQFISTDVALQVFRDEFLRLIENAEKSAAAAIHELSGAMMQHYAAQYARTNAAIDRYYAVLFATAWVPLDAATTLPEPDYDDLMAAKLDPENVPAEEKARVDALLRPVAQRIPEQLPKIWPKLPEPIRKEVRLNVERMLDHRGIEQVEVPGRDKPLKIDFSQFKVRGAYAENDLGGYFLAMSWLASMPLPIDRPLVDLVELMQKKDVGDRTAFQQWQKIDALVGSFMGRPVDATVQQVVDVMSETKTLNNEVLRKRLLELRGPVPIRDADGGERKLMVTLFPKRVGLDVTFFRALTHPKVKGRGMPSSLDVFATLGNRRATVHASELAGEMADAYREALLQLAGKTPSPTSDRTFWSTDIYHSWLAVLAVLAEPVDLDDELMLEFTRSDAWKDRKLYSALAGYTQLKHSAVLYTMQDIGVECDGESSYYVAVEQPLSPRPRGFVEPHVEFYESLAKLAERTYTDVAGEPKGPNADRWAGQDDPHVNAMNFARDLAEIARHELSGRPLTDDQTAWIEYVGAELEQLTIAMQPTQWTFSTGGDGRSQRGVAVVTDIHTNKQRQQALQIGIGRVFDMWVVVPSEVGQRLTQGGILSFYEFTQPMSDRLTDAQWGSRLEADKAPARPAWTKSFIEE